MAFYLRSSKLLSIPQKLLDCEFEGVLDDDLVLGDGVVILPRSIQQIATGLVTNLLNRNLPAALRCSEELLLSDARNPRFHLCNAILQHALDKYSEDSFSRLKREAEEARSRAVEKKDDLSLSVACGILGYVALQKGGLESLNETRGYLDQVPEQYFSLPLLSAVEEEWEVEGFATALELEVSEVILSTLEPALNEKCLRICQIYIGEEFSPNYGRCELIYFPARRLCKCPVHIALEEPHEAFRHLVEYCHCYYGQRIRISVVFGCGNASVVRLSRSQILESREKGFIDLFPPSVLEAISDRFDPRVKVSRAFDFHDDPKTGFLYTEGSMGLEGTIDLYMEVSLPEALDISHAVRESNDGQHIMC